MTIKHRCARETAEQARCRDESAGLRHQVFPHPSLRAKSCCVRRNLQVQKEPRSAPERKYAGLRASALPYQRLWLGPSVSWEKGMGTARWGISKNRTKVRKYGSTRAPVRVRVHVQST